MIFIGVIADGPRWREPFLKIAPFVGLYMSKEIRRYTDHELSLPIGPTITLDEAKEVVKAVNEF